MANKTKKLKRRHQATTGTLLGTRTPSPPHRTTKTMPLLQGLPPRHRLWKKREMEGNARERDREMHRENQGSEVGKERRRTAGSGSSATAARSPELKP
jgi:hypothetical protein